VEKQNATIEYVLLNNPACPNECVDEMSNETLCFNMHTNGTDDEQPQIGCLIDGGINLFNSLISYIQYPAINQGKSADYFHVLSFFSRMF